ncbi:MAG: hypothetical protein Q9M26_05140 [Mariprofundales bacterium]|nr:hypothetical protein [Mariprofundales bacterium]
MFLFLAWRDILVRYKQTVIGIAWALIRPVLTMVVFTVIFSKLAKLPPMPERRIRLWYSRPCCRGSSLPQLLPRPATA